MSRDDVNTGGWMQMESKDFIAYPDAQQDVKTPENPLTGFSIIQWETSQYITYEGKEMICDMSRLGDASGTASVKFHTVDRSAKVGEHYEQKSGTVTFEPGEITKEVRIKCLRNASCTGTTQFHLKISDVEGAMMGKYLHTASCKIIDMDTFPTSKYKEKLKLGDPDVIRNEINHYSLIWEYIKWNFSLPIQRTATVRTLLANQYNILYKILQLYLLKKIIDILSHASHSDSKERKRQGHEEMILLEVYLILWVVPLVAQHYIDYEKTRWKLAGSSRHALQQMLLRKFFNYSELSRSKVKVDNIVMAMIRDSFDLVKLGYESCITGFCCVCKLVLMSIFTGFLLKEPFAYFLVPGTVLLTICFLLPRQKILDGLIEEEMNMQTRAVNHAIRCVLSFPIIADYDRRDFELRKYDAHIAKYNKAAADTSTHIVNSLYFPEYLFTILTAMIIQILGEHIIHHGENGIYDASHFVTLYQIIGLLGAIFQELYIDCIEISKSFGALTNITAMINLRVDLEERMEQNEIRRMKGKVVRSLIREDIDRGRIVPSNDDVAADLMPIMLKNITYAHEAVEAAPTGSINDNNGSGPTQPPSPITVRSWKINVDIEFQQGSIIAITGGQMEGKATLLRILAQSIFPQGNKAGDFEDPTEPLLFIPPHLRAVQISQEPFILGPQETVFDNVSYGLRYLPEEGTQELTDFRDRISRILTRLDVHEKIVANLDTPDFVGADGSKLSKTNRWLLHVARAFVMNPEVLIVHKPTALVDDHHGQLIMEMMREFVDQRGVEMPKNEPMIKRRKRTAICTFRSDLVAMKYADEMFEMDGGSLRKLKAGEAPEGLDVASSLSASNLKERSTPKTPQPPFGSPL